MSRIVGFALALAAIVRCARASADVWNEVGDAGQNGQGAAQVVVGISPLTSIIGVLGQGLGGNDVDVYQILITDFLNFSAQSVGGLDTMLWLFKADGTGQVMNDDITPGTNTLSLITSQGVTSNGLYFLGVSRFNNRPLDAANNQVFSTTLTWPGPHAFQYQANPLAGAFDHWTGSAGDGGGYRIVLTGASSVPAPGALGLLAAMGIMGRRRRGCA